MTEDCRQAYPRGFSVFYGQVPENVVVVVSILRKPAKSFFYDFSRLICSFICMLIGLSGLVSVHKKKKNIYSKVRLRRLINIHVKE